VRCTSPPLHGVVHPAPPSSTPRQPPPSSPARDAAVQNPPRRTVAASRHPRDDGAGRVNLRERPRPSASHLTNPSEHSKIEIKYAIKYKDPFQKEREKPQVIWSAARYRRTQAQMPRGHRLGVLFCLRQASSPVAPSSAPPVEALVPPRSIAGGWRARRAGVGRTAPTNSSSSAAGLPPGDDDKTGDTDTCTDSGGTGGTHFSQGAKVLRLDPVPARVVRRTTHHAGVAPVLGAPVADMEGTEAAAIVASSPWAAAAMRPERRRGAGDAVDA